jgi:hypothetical protein
MTALLKENSQDAIPSVEAADTLREASPPTPPIAARSEVQIDDTGTMVCYANFCRVTGTPEELILDFGLNAQPMGAPTNIEIKQRLVMNYFTAKRLFQALGMSIQRHETAFGVLETDVQKRVTPSLRRAGAPA